MADPSSEAAREILSLELIDRSFLWRKVTDTFFGDDWQSIGGFCNTERPEVQGKQEIYSAEMFTYAQLESKRKSG